MRLALESPDRASGIRTRTAEALRPIISPRGASPGIDLESVFRDHGGRVFAVARRLLGNDADAEDVTQEVLIQVMRKAATFRGDSSLATWLYRVTVNAALILRRKRVAWRERPMTDPLSRGLEDSPPAQGREWGGPPDQIALDREAAAHIEAAIAGLPALYKSPYVLADVEGMSNAEIGEILGLGLAAVKSRLHRARLLMRDALAPYVKSS